jgi:anaerobic nitric oxide reductase flavorubredoxin
MVMELKDDVHWVGVVDWDLRHFHGYELSTHRGSSYNAYLILDERPTLVDTVWGPFEDELIENISRIIDPSEIQIVVANHSESDHSGALPAVLRCAPDATVVVSRRGQQSVEGHYHQPWNFRAVTTGDRINIGKSDLVFVEAPMLHWPDSMFTYVTGRNILMPNDAFGQHYATAFRFNDQVNQKELFEEALKYYVNIVTPFSAQVIRKIEELKPLNLPIDMIAPSHGVIWRDEPMQIVEKYLQWAAQEPGPSAVILFDTMWNGTRRMAEAIGQGLADGGVDYKILHVGVTDRNDALVEVFKARTVIIGSPTLNGGLLPSITPILEGCRGLKFQNKIGAAFGSFGWSGESVRLIEEHFAACSIPVAREGIRCKWQPREEELAECREFGRQLAEVTKNE